jgi:SAM-dependent methyltransferase
MKNQTAGKSRLKYSGTGPGEQTLDGCSVEFYQQLPATDQELACIVKGHPAPAKLLELGCGAGRLTHPLVKAGYTVTAVDNSQAMLSRIVGAAAALSDIESLELETTYEVVLLASRLLNCPNDEIRNMMLATARGHLEVGGTLLAEVHDPDILKQKVGDGGAGEHYAASIISSQVIGSRAKITIEYRVEQKRWRHSFETEYLPLSRIEAALKINNLHFEEWINPSKTWMRVTAV